MRKLSFLIVFVLCSIVAHAQSSDFTVDFAKFGTIKLNTKITELSKYVEGTISESEYEEGPLEYTVRYKGEPIIIEVGIELADDGSTYSVVSGIRTESQKFKTSAGIGVGNTRDEVIEAYKNYPAFSVYPGWDDEGNRKMSESYFELTDVATARTILFRFENNRVVEISLGGFYDL